MDELSVLKNKYEEISDQIRELNIKQSLIRNEMEKICDHRYKVLVDFIEGEYEKHKCKDCFTYIFIEEE